MAIHGGAGTILKEDMTPELEAAYIEGLAGCLEAGYAVLEEGGSAVNAVKAAMVVLEDNVLVQCRPGFCIYQKRSTGNGCSHHGW